MADSGLEVPLKIKFTNIDEEVRATSEKLASLNSLLKSVTGDSIGEIAEKHYKAQMEKYKEEIEKAKEEAIREIDEKAPERLDQAQKEAHDLAKEKALESGKSYFDAETEGYRAGQKAREEEAKKIEEEKKKKEEEVEKKYQDKAAGNAKYVMDSNPNNVDKEVMGLMKGMSSTLKGLADSSIKFTKQIFNIVEDVYREMRNASPLLQTMETLFNLAWQMFFMPLGNKLGEILIPAVIHLVENVMEMWDKFEDMDLGQMISFAIKEGVTMMATYFNEIGGILAGQSGVVGDIGKLLQSIGSFIEKYGLKLVELVMNIVSFVIEHINVIIMGIFELMLASIAAMAAIHTTQMANHASLIAFLAIALAKESFGTSIAAGVAASVPAVVGTSTFVGVELAGNIAGAHVGNKTGLNVTAGDMFDTAGDALGIGKGLVGLAEGGHVAPEPNGVIVRVAEAGEGEWMIPDSKMKALLKGDALPELGLHPLSEKSDSITNTVTNYSNSISNSDVHTTQSQSYQSYFGMDRGITPSISNVSTDYANTSNVSMPSSSVVINLYIEGYTDEDLGDKIVRKLNEEINLSRLRSGL